MQRAVSERCRCRVGVVGRSARGGGGSSSVRRHRGLRDARPSLAAAAAKENTLRSLDNLLGSRDEEPEAEEQAAAAAGAAEAPPTQQVFRPLAVPEWAWRELREPRVVPLASNALYYCLLLVFVAYYAVQLGPDGPQTADDLLARLVNDHAAVASGDTLRLFTAAFVTEAVPALIVGLVALATLAGELESLVGYSAFWALFTLVVLSGSLADAAFSSLPITSGPAAAVAGLAAALLAHHARNWRIEQLLQQMQTTGDVPQELLASVDALNAERAREWQREHGREAAPASMSRAAAAAATTRAASSSSSSGGGGELLETELEAPVPFMEGFTVLLPREGKALVTLAGAAASVVSALHDAFARDGMADWTGLSAGFVCGLLLGWSVCPVYEVALEEVDPTTARASSTSSSRPLPRSAGGSSSTRATLLLPVLRDTRPPAARANAVVGFAGLLFASLGTWLVTSGAFLD